MRLSGHTLWYEGAAHDDRGVVVLPIRRGGRGRGKCSCGALSDTRPQTSAARLGIPGASQPLTRRGCRMTTARPAGMTAARKLKPGTPPIDATCNNGRTSTRA